MGLCRDCYYAKSGSGRYLGWICTRTGSNRKVDGFDSCSKFVSEDANSCFECEYAEPNLGIFSTSEKDYFCKKKSKRINSKDVACNDFVEEI